MFAAATLWLVTAQALDACFGFRPPGGADACC